jgi:prepilin-type N-terminal cleavage/methylation domain-containing protein
MLRRRHRLLAVEFAQAMVVGGGQEMTMRARAFTLIELMIAVAITVTLAGIVLPIGISRLNAASFAHTQRQLSSSVAIARAEAQRQSAVCRLLATREDDRTLIWSESQSHQEADLENPSSREFILDLPEGSSIRPMPSQEDDEDEAAEKPQSELPEVPRTLCILMPDGTVVPGESTVLVGRGGEMARFEFNPWTGSLTFIPLPRASLTELDTQPGVQDPEPEED